MKYRVTFTMEYDCAVEVEANSESDAINLAYGRMDADDYDEREFAASSNWNAEPIGGDKE